MSHRAACAAILAGLPEWFGFESANAAYIAALERLPAFVALHDDAVVGFIAIEEHTPHAAEVHVLAVAREQHRQGIGGRLLAHAEARLRGRGFELLHVKTLGPSDPDLNYARTRAFYEAHGFRPLFESTAFWGESQPALVMVKVL
ncbi:MAG: GNAT family N-acetyltransferase [Dehalococcoidia bacterium]